MNRQATTLSEVQRLQIAEVVERNLIQLKITDPKEQQAYIDRMIKVISLPDTIATRG